MDSDFALTAESSSAVIDPTGKYRYQLARVWDRTRTRMLFVMLNPSTADADTDDPTIRKCAGFAKKWGYGALEVVNLYALRATDPDEIWRDDAPVGPENDAYILDAAGRARIIVAAWGAQPKSFGRAAYVGRMLVERRYFLWALRFTKDGHPEHPLYLPGGAELLQYPLGLETQNG